MRQILTYRPADVREYINWIYFFHSWEFEPQFAAAAHVCSCRGCTSAWVMSFPEEKRGKAHEALKLYHDAAAMLDRMQDDCTTRVAFDIVEAHSQGDDIVAGQHVIPFLRQQTPDPRCGFCLCLADFVNPETGKDSIGVFAASTQSGLAQKENTDIYASLLAKTLEERLTEAAVEKTHLKIRREIWGYAPDENLPVKDLLDEKFCGIRPAVGYPSIPDQSVNFIIDSMLGMGDIGITLTPNGAMSPPASVSGFMFSHPQSRYFKVGRISEEQLEDYARRRKTDTATMKKFLIPNTL